MKGIVFNLLEEVVTAEHERPACMHRGDPQCTLVVRFATGH